ncbi:substrate-binding periplasmic protein [Undibacterium sp. Ji67W]|uniref:substrate-binding periplasmic protein n=1 Tax=Undibacterium sp. Ji67W TaxID=3413042 RepID=UPI003BF34EF5
MKKSVVFFTTISLCLQVNAETFRVAYYDGGDVPFVQTTNGRVYGIFPELMAAIAQKSGDQIEVQALPIKRLLNAFEIGSIDIEVGVNPKWRSASLVPGIYSDPFLVVSDILCYRFGEVKKNERIADFSGDTIGVIANYSYPEFDPAFTSGLIKRADAFTNPNLLTMLKAKRFDQIIISQYVKQYWAKSDPAKYNCEEGRIVESSEVMLRVHPSKASALPRLNAAIESLKKSGELDAIIKRNIN